MKMLARCLTLSAAGFLAACGTSTQVDVCDGWEKLTPSGATRQFLLTQDPPFTDQVISHNLHGQRQGCWE